MLDLEEPKFKRFGNENVLKDLTNIIKGNRVIPFVGAGMSIDIYGGWGLALKSIMKGNDSVKKAKEAQVLISSRKFEAAAEKISELLGTTSFQDQLVAVFGDSKITDDKLRKMSVLYLPKIFKSSLVVTTNFDKVLERVFMLEQHPFEEKVVLQHLTGWQAERALRGSLHYLIKIHGCVSAPDEVVLTETLYNGLYRKDSPHLLRLCSILGGNKLLFIGCGLNEDRTVALLQEGNLGGHYAILEMNGEAEEDTFQERRLFMSNNLNMHCIWYPKGEHKYVKDILEYIYADINGLLEMVELPVKADSGVRQNSKPLKANEPASVPKRVVNLIVKNGFYTIGRWKNNPMQWLILDVQLDKALLIAKDCLLKAPYNEKYEIVTWEQCSLRKELFPKLFDQLFNETEGEQVLLSKNMNPDNDKYKVSNEKETYDKLFLLSFDEVKKYFLVDEARTACLDGDKVFWLLRSPGSFNCSVATVTTDGSINEMGGAVNWIGAVRPAFWLNLKSNAFNQQLTHSH